MKIHGKKKERKSAKVKFFVSIVVSVVFFIALQAMQVAAIADEKEEVSGIIIEGDVNLDGQVTLEDARLSLRAALGNG